MTRYSCLCCGFRTLTEPPPGTFEICPVCYWEDDNVQAADDTALGANDVSLRQAKENFRRTGASEDRHQSQVRAPRSEELP